MYRDTLSSYSTRSIGTSPQPAMAPKRRVADAAVVAQRQRLLRLLERQILCLHVDGGIFSLLRQPRILVVLTTSTTRPTSTGATAC